MHPPSLGSARVGSGRMLTRKKAKRGFCLCVSLASGWQDFVDAITHALMDIQQIHDSMKTLMDHDFDVPADLQPKSIQRDLTEAKFFVAAASAWDMMLTREFSDLSVKQRKAEVQEFQKSLPLVCPLETFPASLMKLVDLWGTGEDIADVCP